MSASLADAQKGLQYEVQDEAPLESWGSPDCSAETDSPMNRRKEATADRSSDRPMSFLGLGFVALYCWIVRPRVKKIGKWFHLQIFESGQLKGLQMNMM